jgi:hypothetical protein
MGCLPFNRTLGVISPKTGIFEEKDYLTFEKDISQLPIR